MITINHLLNLIYKKMNDLEFDVSSKGELYL